MPMPTCTFGKTPSTIAALVAVVTPGFQAEVRAQGVSPARAPGTSEGAALVPVPVPTPAPAPPPGGSAQVLPEVVVRGRPEDQLGAALTASEGTVGAEDLEDLPLLRPGELVEAVPGMVVTQHSGDGKANQYFLRGFNLDHGTDFAFSVDGVPVNLPTHAHGQGYSDLNFLIPELVDAIDFKKGPFFAEVGDFSGAGAANIHLVNRLPEGIATLQVGAFGYARVLLADSHEIGPGTLLYALAYDHEDGPWELQERSNRTSGLLRYRWGHGPDSYRLTGSLSWAPQWRSSDQVAERAIDQGLIGRFGTIDPTDGGNTGRGALSFDWTRSDGDTTTKLLLYGFLYRLNLWSNFTYALDDPANLDQFEQIDRRLVTGGELTRTWQRTWWGKRVENTIGLQVRNDFIPDSGLDHTAARELVQVALHDRVEEVSGGLHVRNQIRWARWFKTEVGLRGDLFAIHVDSDTAANSGNRAAGILSPKATLVLGPWSQTELYLDVGAGFHSNDARGVTVRVDPMTLEAQRGVPLLVRIKGAEVGARTAIVPGLISTLSLWFLQSDSELTFAGDSGDTEANGSSRRYGIEWANFYRPAPWLTLSADLAFTHARYLEPQGAADGQSGLFIANAIPLVVSGAAAIETPSGVFGGVRLRHFGSQPITEDDSQRQAASTIVNLRVGHRFGRYEVSADALNLFDAKSADVAYFYRSRLPGTLTAAHNLGSEPAAGVNDVHLHPAEPFQLRGSLTAHF